MAKPKEIAPKITLEREYIVPLRKGWLKVPRYKRAKKAVKTLKEFVAQHMKIYDRDLRKIKVDIDLNNEIRFKGMKKPPAKIKVKVKKYDNDIVRVELVDIPANIRFKRLREEKKKADIGKKIKAKEETKKSVEEKASSKEDTSKKAEGILEKEKDSKKEEEIKEKEQTSKDETLKLAKEQAKELKHVAKDKGVKIQRKALSR